MAAAIMPLVYLPNISWFQNFLKYESVLIEREENFVKSTYRNRCEIANAAGKMALSIPIIGGRDHHQKYKDVKISYKTNWQHQHWQSLLSSYGSTPFFEFYADRVQNFYEKEFELLFDFNLELLHMILASLTVKSKLPMTSTYEKLLIGTVDLRNINKLKTEQIEIPRYYQVFEERNGFISNLCILDLLFHKGPQSIDYLERLQ